MGSRSSNQHHGPFGGVINTVEMVAMEQVEQDADGHLVSVSQEMLEEWVTGDQANPWTNKEIGLGFLAGAILLWTGWTVYKHFDNLGDENNDDTSSSSEEE